MPRHGTELQERLLQPVGASRPTSPTHCTEAAATQDEDTHPPPPCVTVRGPGWLGDACFGLVVTTGGVAHRGYFWEGGITLRAWMRALGLWRQRSLLQEALERRRASLHGLGCSSSGGGRAQGEDARLTMNEWWLKRLMLGGLMFSAIFYIVLHFHTGIYYLLRPLLIAATVMLPQSPDGAGSDNPHEFDDFVSSFVDLGKVGATTALLGAIMVVATVLLTGVGVEPPSWAAILRDAAAGGELDVLIADAGMELTEPQQTRLRAGVERLADTMPPSPTAVQRWLWHPLRRLVVAAVAYSLWVLLACGTTVGFSWLQTSLLWGYASLGGCACTDDSGVVCHHQLQNGTGIQQQASAFENAFSGSSLGVRLGSVSVPFIKALLAALSGFGGLLALRAVFDPRGAALSDGATKRIVVQEAALRRATVLPDNSIDEPESGVAAASIAGAPGDPELEVQLEPGTVHGAADRDSNSSNDAGVDDSDTDRTFQVPTDPCPCEQCQSYIHYGVRCDASGTTPIVGNRWWNEKTKENVCDAVYGMMSTAEQRSFALQNVHIDVERRATWAAIVTDGDNQVTWEQARVALHLNDKQARWVSRSKLVLWHWSQPVAYLFICSLYFCGLDGTSDDDDEALQCYLAAIVATRELLYWLLTVIAYAKVCPAFVLLELGSIWQAEPVPTPEVGERGSALIKRHVRNSEGRSGRVSRVEPRGPGNAVRYWVVYEGACGDDEEEQVVAEAEVLSSIVHWTVDTTELYHWIIYIFAPHYYVTLCLRKRCQGSGDLPTIGRYILQVAAAYEFYADCCGAMALYMLLEQDNAPVAMALGYWLTLCGMVVGLGSAWALVIVQVWTGVHYNAFSTHFKWGKKLPCVLRILMGIIYVPFFGLPVIFGAFLLVATPLQLVGDVHVAQRLRLF